MRQIAQNLIVTFLLAFASCTAPAPASDAPDASPHTNRVIVLGMIHSGHETSPHYSTKRIAGVIRAIDPDYVLTEIPPDRLAEAVRSFKEDGDVTEPRVARFPEYVDALFPLTKEMDFEIIPTAGWTREMADFRSGALRALSQDPTRADDWEIYQAAIAKMNEDIGDRGDDPYFIHSAEYDAITKTGLTSYADLFANDLGSGDWHTINQAHYTLIENALDAHTDEGATLLITFGAGHKYWFLEQLEKRTDIDLVSPLPYFDKVPAERTP